MSLWQLLDAKGCAALLSISVGAWYDWVRNDPTAPQPVLKAGKGKTAFSRWLLADVEAYTQLLIKEQRTGYIAEAHEKEESK